MIDIHFIVANTLESSAPKTKVGCGRELKMAHILILHVFHVVAINILNRVAPKTKLVMHVNQTCHTCLSRFLALISCLVYETHVLSP